MSSYGVRNFNKWDNRKTDKIKKLEDTVSELTEKIKIVETREIAVEKKHTREKVKLLITKINVKKAKQNFK